MTDANLQPETSQTVVESVPRGGATQEGPVTVMASYALYPGTRELWLDVWSAVGRSAVQLPECRRVTLLTHPDDPTLVRVISTWTSAQAFHRFVREAGLVWLERHLPSCREAAAYCIGVSVPLDASWETVREYVPEGKLAAAGAQ